MIDHALVRRLYREGLPARYIARRLGITAEGRMTAMPSKEPHDA